MLVLGAAIVALSLAAVALTAPSSRHLDGAGPLASHDGDGSEMMAVDPDAPGHPTSWTYGLRLCLASGTEPAVIKSVGPAQSVGSGYRSLGAGIRRFTPTTDHTPVIGLPVWPPDPKVVPDQLAPIDGYAVTTPCSQDPQAPYTELLIGLGRQGTDGGGWNGVDVAYRVGRAERILAIDQKLFICGPAVAAQCAGE